MKRRCVALDGHTDLLKSTQIKKANQDGFTDIELRFIAAEICLTTHILFTL